MCSVEFAMRPLPAVDDRLFPANTRGGIVTFWVVYWFWFFVMLPWMLVRQLFVSGYQLAGALWTWNRTYQLFDGALTLQFVSSLRSLIVTTLFGERFVALRYRDLVIDPGPPFGAERLLRQLEQAQAPVAGVVVTHAHEEHLGNAPAVARRYGIPIFGTPFTLAAVRRPEQLSYPRRTLMGQPQPSHDLAMIPFAGEVHTPQARLEVIESPGHCRGHASLFDDDHKILFAGDSFLHAIFTAPNADVSSHDWIETLERYRALDVRTMVGTHGTVESCDPAVPRRFFVTERLDPRALIARKLESMEWARAVVAEGERRCLPYSVIEACLFPWRGGWASRNWFNDESWRLFTGGEFSRTHFVRSLSVTPQRVPPRFPFFMRLRERFTGR
jgi:glyoxylase-like metal-dependent hydrolase (beta-lactamase superfamily II)